MKNWIITLTITITALTIVSVVYGIEIRAVKDRLDALEAAHEAR